MVGTDGAAPVAQDLIGRLADRGWEGDAELAEQLTALTGGPPTGRRTAPADLDELTDLLEGVRSPRQAGSCVGEARRYDNGL